MLLPHDVEKRSGNSNTQAWEKHKSSKMIQAYFFALINFESTRKKSVLAEIKLNLINKIKLE